MGVSVVLFLIGLIRLIIDFVQDKPKNKSLKILITGIAMFVIGFGTCIAVINLN